LDIRQTLRIIAQGLLLRGQWHMRRIFRWCAAAGFL